MSSLFVIESNIQKKEKELEERRKELRVEEARAKALHDAVAERRESLEQLLARLESTSEEIKAKDVELDNLRRLHEARMAKMEELRGGAAATAADAATLERLSAMTASDGIHIVMEELRAMDSRLRGVTDEADAARKKVGQVTVTNQALGDSCTFRITPDYTFAQLCADACRYWGVNPADGTLRDHFNALWPLAANVQEELAKPGEKARIQLVTQSRAVEVRPRHGGARKRVSRTHSDSESESDAEADYKRGPAPAMATPLAAAEDEDVEERTYRRAVASTKRAMASKLSAFFHGPKYSAQAVKFKGFSSENSTPESDAREDMMALLLQILLYIAFLVVLIYPMLARTQVGPSHDTHAGLVQSLVDRRFDAEDAPDGTCSFREINSPLQFHRWVRGPLLQELFSPSDYNGLPLPMSQQALVRGSHQLVGGVRLRQFRVRNDSCTVAPGFRRALAPHGCFAMYSLDRRDTAHFGAGEAVEGFHYHPGTPLSSFSFIARDALYDTGGFSAELPPERGLAQMVLDNLEAGGWVDRSTRAVVLTFNLLNVNYNVLTAARMLVEFSPSGDVLTSYQFDVLPTSMYAYGASEQGFSVLVAMDFVCFVYVVYALYKSALEGLLYGARAFMGTLWNLLDMATCSMVLALIVLRILYDTITVVRMDVQVPHHVQLGYITSMHDAIQTISATNIPTALLATFNALKFVRSNSKVSNVWQTLAMAAGNMGAYFFIFFIIIGAFVLVAFFVFGRELASFRTPMLAAEQVLVMLTGSVRYEQLRLADSVMAPIFFGGFIFVIFFVMVNYFLSILNDAYYTVHMNTLETKQSFWLDLAMAPLLCFGKGKRQRQSRADGKAGAGAAKDA